MGYFGVSAFKKPAPRHTLNMNVPIAIGALAAFVYSPIGTLGHFGHGLYLYETTATIITLVFLGEWVEHKSVQNRTQKELNKLAKQQKVMANMIAFDDQHHQNSSSRSKYQTPCGDLIPGKTGEQVPVDCKILWGDVHVNESLLTGESKPVRKKKRCPHRRQHGYRRNGKSPGNRRGKRYGVKQHTNPRKTGPGREAACSATGR